MYDEKSSLQSAGNDRAIPAPPKVDLYYAYGEDMHPLKRINTAYDVFTKERVPPRRKPVKDFQAENEVMNQYLTGEPPSFIIFGKPGLNHIEVAWAIADISNCVLISPSALMQQFNDTTESDDVERILPADEWLGPEIMDFIRYRIGMRDVRNRGYVLTGLPFLPPIPDSNPNPQTCEPCANASEGSIERDNSDNDKEQIDYEQEITRVINEIFTLWPMKPLIIVYLVCPSEDVASKYLVDKILEAEELTMQDEDEIQYDALDSLFDTENKNIKDNDFAIQNYNKKYIETKCEFYERLALPVINKWILAHDPRRVIRMDGRNSLQRIVQILKTRLCILAVQPSILPKHMIDKMKTNEEIAGKSVEESFQILRQKEIVSPKFPWGLSAWNFYCPVMLAKGKLVKGLATYAVQFMNKIFFLSSEEAENLFVENPRMFLSPPNPRPTCKVAVFGPRYCGKSELCEQLAKNLRGTVIDVNEIVSEYMQQIAEEGPRIGIYEDDIVVHHIWDWRIEGYEISVNEMADIIVNRIKDIPDEILEDNIYADARYIVDGFYMDIELWRKVVSNANVKFDDIIILFEEEPYIYLTRKFSRPADYFMEYEEEYETDYMAENEILRKDEKYYEYIEHLLEFESNWKQFQREISDFEGNVIKCNLADIDVIKDISKYVISHIWRPFTITEETEEEDEEKENLVNAKTEEETPALGEKRPPKRSKAFTVDLEMAEQLLECGYYFLSSFGRWCPVQMYTNKIPIQMFLPMKARGQIFPVVWYSYIYFLGGKEALYAFLADPHRYQYFNGQNLATLPIPLRMSIIGPPNCGKTTVANRFAETYGMKVINVAKALHNMLKYYHWLESVQMIENQFHSEQPVPIKSIIRAIEILSLELRATTQGYILDDFPFTQEQAELLTILGMQPMIVLYLKTDLSDEDLTLRKNRKMKLPYMSAKYLRQHYTNKKSQTQLFLDWLNNFSQNMVEIDATKSKWFVWTRANHAMCSRFAEIMLYSRDADLDKVHHLRYICVSPCEFEKRQSQWYKSYCPLCLFRNTLNASIRPVNAEGIVQFREHFYWICSKHLKMFVKDPLEHLAPNNIVLPDNLPEIIWKTIDVEHTCWKQRLQIEGMCPVHYIKNSSDQRLIAGRADLGVMYMNKVYLLCSEKCHGIFLARPHKYFKVDMYLDKDIIPLDLRRLTDTLFLKKTLIQLLFNSIYYIVKHRPKIYGLSPCISAAIYIGIYLKMHNGGTINEIDIYERVNNRIMKQDMFIRKVTEKMKKELNPYVFLPKYSD